MTDKWVVKRADGKVFRPGDKVKRWGVVESFYSIGPYLWAICKGKKRMRVTVRDLKKITNN